MIRTCSYLKNRRGAFAASLVLAVMAAVPTPMPGQWNGTNPIWTNSNVGIGTTAPGYPLTVVASAPWSGQFASSSTSGSLIAVTANAATGHDWWLMSTASANSQGSGKLNFYDATAARDRFTIDGSGNVGIGTTNPQHLLQVSGTIGAQEVIVSSTGADYVFDPNYELKPLSAVASYIQEHRHLPDIPSAEDVRKVGLSVGEMQTKLLAKIEELTLHMIRADERGNRLEAENHELRERLARVEAKQ